MDTDEELTLRTKIQKINAVYKRVMDQLNRSRLEQFRIVDAYIAELKEQRLQELRDSISGRKTNTK